MPLVPLFYFAQHKFRETPPPKPEIQDPTHVSRVSWTVSRVLSLETRVSLVTSDLLSPKTRLYEHSCSFLVASLKNARIIPRMILLRATSPASGPFMVEVGAISAVWPAAEGGSNLSIPGLPLGMRLHVIETWQEIAALRRAELKKAKACLAWFTASGTIVSS